MINIKFCFEHSVVSQKRNKRPVPNKRPPLRFVRSWVRVTKGYIISAKFELRYESLKSKFSLILFAYNLMIGYPKKTRETIPESAFDKKKKKPGLKFNPGLALTGVRTTGSQALNQIITVTKITMFKFSPLCSSFLPW